MLASTYNAGSMLCSDYGPLEWIGGHDSGVYRGRGNDGRYVALRFCAIDSDPARSALIEMVYTASLVRHPMLTAVAGCQSYAGGALCLVSEYVPGQSLDRWIAEHGRPALRITIDFIHRLCLGLHAAHQRGLAHHALHPGNLMVLQPDTQPGGRIVAKLLDLGVPAFVRPWPPRAAAVPYTAPELLGDRAPACPLITPLMNVYSAGALLHYLCTGTAPDRDADGELDPACLRQLGAEMPESLARLIVRSLSVDPHKRPASAAEFAASLGRIESEWRTSGVRRRDRATATEAEAGQDRDSDRESQAVLHTRVSRPSAVPSLDRQPGARRSGSRRATPDGATSRVHPHEPRPATGSFPRLEIPASRRWAAGLTVGALLAIYFASLPSGADRSAATATRPATETHATASRAESAPLPRAVVEPATDIEPSRPIELPAPIEPMTEHARAARAEMPAPPSKPSANPARAEIAAAPLSARRPDATAIRVTRTERAKERRSPPASQPTAAGSLARDVAPAIPPAPLPARLSSVEVEPPAAAAPRPRIASEVEAAPSPQAASAGGSEPFEVQVDSVNVRGSLTLSVVRRAIERIRPMLTQCYRRHLRAGQASFPTLQVSATIDEVGRVRSPNVAGGTLPALNECVVKVTSKMVADAPDTGLVRVSWQLNL